MTGVVVDAEIVFGARDGPTPPPRSFPPYPPLGRLTINSEGLHWTHSPRSRWNPLRWGESRPKLDMIDAPWAAVDEIRLEFVFFGLPRDLVVHFETGGRQRFGGVRARRTRPVLAALGVDLVKDWRNPAHEGAAIPPQLRSSS